MRERRPSRTALKCAVLVILMLWLKKTVDHEFEELLQELSSDITVEEFLEFDDCVYTCEPEMKYDLLIGEKNCELNLSNQLPIEMLNVTTIALNPKTMKKMQWKSIQSQQ